MAKSADYSLGPNPIPRGWFIVAESSELGREPMALRYFGEDLALYRGESGTPVLLDAYCPHMGTHIAASKTAMIVKNGQQIEGDSIRCPYHGWRFAPDGSCDDIPYFDGPCPKSAKIRSYPVRETMGCVMAWYDPEGREPDFEPPFLPEWDDPQWVHWQLDHLGELDIHPQEILDNMADAQHLGPTHGAPCEYFENEFRDHICIQRQGGFIQTYNTMLHSTTWYTGPGLLLSKQAYGNVLSYELIANTPVEDGKVKVWHAALYRGSNKVASEQDVAAAREVQAGALLSFSADFDVWHRKKPAINMIQLPTDGPFSTVRNWYKQFYLAPGDVAAQQQQLNGVHHTKSLPPPSEEAREIEVGLFE